MVNLINSLVEYSNMKKTILPPAVLVTIPDSTCPWLLHTDQRLRFESRK